MKKNRLFVLGIITMFVAILSLTLVSGTMARYTSTVSGSDDAKVAKWAFAFNNADIDLASTKKVSFNLFETICEVDGITAEVHVDETGETLIAPGTGGKFEFDITNKSQVYATYEIQFSAVETNGDIPLEYSLDGGSWASDISSLNIDATELAYGATSSEVVVYWRWAFAGNNDVDTTLGIAAAATVTVTATIIFNQVD